MQSLIAGLMVISLAAPFSALADRDPLVRRSVGGLRCVELLGVDVQYEDGGGSVDVATRELVDGFGKAGGVGEEGPVDCEMVAVCPRVENGLAVGDHA